MEIFILVVIVVLVAAVCGWLYEMGWNGGFDKGWRDCAVYCGGRKGPTWQEAVMVLKETCADDEHECDESCPMYKWCTSSIPDSTAPNRWDDPEV